MGAPIPSKYRRRRLTPWHVLRRALLSARHQHEGPVVLILTLVPSVWAITLFLPHDTIGTGAVSVLDGLGGENAYASVLALLVLGLWLGLCRVIPRLAFRCVILATITWWLFVSSSILAHDGYSLLGWSLAGKAFTGWLAFLSTARDHDAETQALVDALDHHRTESNHGSG